MLQRQYEGKTLYHNSAPNSQLWLCMFQRNRRWQGWMVGRKTTDEIGCWYTLMNSMNELRSVTFARKTFVSWRRLRPLKVGLRHRKLILKKLTYVEKNLTTTHPTKRGRMWSFVNTYGSHSLPTKIKTHYSCRVQLQ